MRVVALDDESSDGTRDWLVERAAHEPRLTVLPSMGPSGRSAADFYRLIALVEPPADGYLAFSDQDDIWLPGKLARHVELLRSGGHDGISSSVTAFSSSGERTVIRKDYPQRRFDYLTESPGPGCSFLLSPRLAALVAAQLAGDDSPARATEYHDSLIYALARGRGWSWHIDGVPSLDYRQHDSNVMGANTRPQSGVDAPETHPGAVAPNTGHHSRALRTACGRAGDARRARADAAVARGDEASVRAGRSRPTRGRCGVDPRTARSSAF